MSAVRGLPLGHSVHEAPPCRALRITRPWKRPGYPGAWGFLTEPLFCGPVTLQVPETQNSKLVLWLKYDITCELWRRVGTLKSIPVGLVLFLERRILYFSTEKLCKSDARNIYYTTVWELMSFNPLIYFRTFWDKCFVHWGRLLVHRGVVWKSQ